MSKPSDNNLIRIDAADLSAPTQAQIDGVKAIDENTVDTTDLPELRDEELARADRPTILRLDPANRRWLLSQPNPGQLMDELIRQYRNHRTG